MAPCDEHHGYAWRLGATCTSQTKGISHGYHHKRRSDFPSRHAVLSRRDELLNPQFDAWRKNEQVHLRSNNLMNPGSFDWMVTIYKSSPQYQKLLPKTRKDYDSALRLVSEYTLKNGRSFGTLALESINPGAADRLFEQLKNRSSGEERVRTAILSVTVCKRA
jgi:hypothetical protein